MLILVRNICGKVWLKFCYIFKKIKKYKRNIKLKKQLKKLKNPYFLRLPLLKLI